MEQTIFSAFSVYMAHGMEWYWQYKTEIFWGKPFQVPLCAPHIPRRLACDWTQPSAVSGKRLTTWVMTW